MKICRFNDNRIGIVRDDIVYDVTKVIEQELPAYRYPFPVGDQLIANLDSLRPKLETMADMVDGVQVSELTLRSPIANPTKIIGVPQNYQDHADEAAADTGISQGLPRRKMEDQGLFLKANSALIGPGEGVAIRFSERRTDHEAELGVIIGRKGSNIELQVMPLLWIWLYAAKKTAVFENPSTPMLFWDHGWLQQMKYQILEILIFRYLLIMKSDKRICDHKKDKQCQAEDLKCKEVMKCKKCKNEFVPTKKSLKEWKRKIKDG